MGTGEKKTELKSVGLRFLGPSSAELCMPQNQLGSAPSHLDSSLRRWEGLSRAVSASFWVDADGGSS